MHCYRCGHDWIPRSDSRPKACPKCRSSRYEFISGNHICESCGTVWRKISGDDPCPNCGLSYANGSLCDSFECNRCGHTWKPRTNRHPGRCPSCKSRRWDDAAPSWNTCHRCGYLWEGRTSNPGTCPKCRSAKWNSDTFKLKCYRCGHKWKLQGVTDPDYVQACPSCGSRKWREPQAVARCLRCEKYYILDCLESSCPNCFSNLEIPETECGFCGMRFLQSRKGKAICPRCGLIIDGPPGKSESLELLWHESAYRLNYLFKDGIGCVYLWNGSDPEGCEYLDRILRDTKLRFASFIGRARDERYGTFWRSLVDRLLSSSSDYRQDIDYFMERLSLTRVQSEILSLHFTGMSPEVISLKTRIPMSSIRSEFTAIQRAFKTSGIEVNDSVYTDNPKDFYDGKDSS